MYSCSLNFSINLSIWSKTVFSLYRFNTLLFNCRKFLIRIPQTCSAIATNCLLYTSTEAHVLISGGRGVGNAEGFDMLRAMANTIGAEVSASRAMVDAGVLGHERQVGQTGKTVRPDLYFAMGISGAIQHLAGMEERCV